MHALYLCQTARAAALQVNSLLGARPTAHRFGHDPLPQELNVLLNGTLATRGRHEAAIVLAGARGLPGQLAIGLHHLSELARWTLVAATAGRRGVARRSENRRLSDDATKRKDRRRAADILAAGSIAQQLLFRMVSGRGRGRRHYPPTGCACAEAEACPGARTTFGQ